MNENKNAKWSELILLLYKKFYQEVCKIRNILKKRPIKNPFVFKNLGISPKEIIPFIKSKTGQDQLQSIESEIKRIEKLLKNYEKMFL